VNDDGSKDFQCVTLGKGLRVKKDWGSGKNPLVHRGWRATLGQWYFGLFLKPRYIETN